MKYSDRIHLAKFTADLDYESIVFEDFNDFDFGHDDEIFKVIDDDMDVMNELEDPYWKK